MLAHLRGSFSGGSGGAIQAARSGPDARRLREKNERTPEYVSRVVRGAVGKACAFLTRETPLHTVVCVVWCGPHVEKRGERTDYKGLKSRSTMLICGGLSCSDF